MTQPDMTILRADERDWRPWPNGGGVSADLLSSENGTAPDWRIALAVIDRDGPFSDFAGFTRTLLHAGGPAFTLVVEGVRHELSAGSQLTFDGGAAVNAVDVTGAVHAFNLFVRTGRVSGSIAVGSSLDLDPGAGSDDTLALLLPASPPAPPAPVAAAGVARSLGPLDAVVVAGAPLRLDPPARVAVVRLTDVSASR